MNSGSSLGQNPFVELKHHMWNSCSPTFMECLTALIDRRSHSTYASWDRALLYLSPRCHTSAYKCSSCSCFSTCSFFFMSSNFLLNKNTESKDCHSAPSILQSNGMSSPTRAWLYVGLYLSELHSCAASFAVKAFLHHTSGMGFDSLHILIPIKRGDISCFTAKPCKTHCSSLHGCQAQIRISQERRLLKWQSQRAHNSVGIKTWLSSLPPPQRNITTFFHQRWQIPL